MPGNGGPPRPAELAKRAPVEPLALLDYTLAELSHDASALWCALEVAVTRPPDPEEDRHDLLAAYQMANQMGHRLRALRHAADQALESRAEEGK
jgi:hypothetical protein